MTCCLDIGCQPGCRRGRRSRAGGHSTSSQENTSLFQWLLRTVRRMTAFMFARLVLMLIVCRNGSLQLLSDNLHLASQKTPVQLGVKVMASMHDCEAADVCLPV